MKNFRMTAKLAIVFLLTGLIPIILLSIIVLSNVTNQLQDQAEDLLTDNVQNKIDNVQGHMNRITEVVEIVGNSGTIKDFITEMQKENFSFDSMQYKNLNAKLDAEIPEINKRLNLMDFYFTSSEGTINYIVNLKNYLGMDASKLPLFPRVVENMSTRYTSFSYLELLDIYRTSVGSPILDQNGDLLGTANVLISADDMANILTDKISAIGDTAEIFMLNGEGIFLTKPVREVELSKEENFRGVTLEKGSYEELVNNINKGIEYSKVSEYKNFNGVDVLGYQGTYLHDDTHVGIVIELDIYEVYSASRDMRKIIFILIVILLVVSIVMIVLISRSITKPIKSLLRNSERISNLNLTENESDPFLSSKDEIGSITSSVKSIKENLNSTVHVIVDSTHHLTASCEQLSVTSSEMIKSIDEVSGIVEHLSNGSRQLANDSEISKEKAEDLSIIIGQNKEFVDTLDVAIKNVGNKVVSSQSHIEELINTSEESRNAIVVVSDKIQLTNESTNKISEASSLIASIADQTNLLALNAAIEAARAGEYGRGFAVVADEIRKLAEESTKSTNSIDSILKELKANSSDSVKQMRSVNDMIESQSSSINEVKESFVEITSSIEAAGDSSNGLNESSTNMTNIKDELTDILSNVTKIAIDFSEDAVSTAAAIEEQNAGFEQINDAIDSMTELARDLTNDIKKFVI